MDFLTDFLTISSQKDVHSLEILTPGKAYCFFWSQTLCFTFVCLTRRNLRYTGASDLQGSATVDSQNFRTILWGIPYHLQLCLKFPWATCVVNTSWNFRDKSTLRQGWRQQSSDGGQELLTGGLKWEKWNGKNAVFVHHFAKFPPTETRNFLQHRGASGFRQGAVAPSGPPLAPRHHCFEAPPCHKDNQKWGSNSIQAIR